MIWKKRRLCSLTTTEYERCLALTEPDRRQQLLAMKNEPRRMAAILGEWMAKTMLAEQSGIPMEEIRILRTEKGKPYAEGLPYFSITHSGEWVAVALSDRPIGIDMELLRPVDPRLAERIGADPEHFFEEWTAKEAHYKIYGDPNFKNICYADLSPLHFYEDGCIITIIEKEK